MDRRWRNKRAAASMNQQQREQAAAGAATASATISPATNQQANSTAPPDLANSLPKRTNFQQQRQQAQSVQLHSLRPTSTQLPNLTSKQPIKSSLVASEPAANEQSALDMAQSAAARVTGSAAAAIAAAKFKMLRSNTLAAAFGVSPSDTDQAVADSTNVAPHDLLVVRTRDERIVNTLSTTSSMMNRNRLNLDAK